MGFKQTFICSNCDYKVVTGAGRDVGMIAINNTFLCMDCNSLQDLRVVKLAYGDFNADKNTLHGDPTCSKCGGKKFVLWDHLSKTCPKCKKGVMNPSTDGFSINWD